MRLNFCNLTFVVAIALSGWAMAADPTTPSVGPDEALSRLKAGNERFAQNKVSTGKPVAARRAETAKEQHPFAIIVGCADSRTAPEIIFDQSIGDLFVIRTAGNLVDDHSLGSIEYAVDHLGTRLIVVLGHQRCGAVQAAKETIDAKAKAHSNIESLLMAIKPAVEATAKDDLDTTLKANVKHVVDAIRSSTPILKANYESGDV